MNKLNFKQPKYIIPLIVLPFLIALSFIIKSFTKENDNKNFVTTEDVNAQIQEPKAIKSKNKIEALRIALKENKEFSGVQNIDKEESQDQVLENAGSLYTTDEMRKIDSINQVTAIKRDSLERITQEVYKRKDFTQNGQQQNEQQQTYQNQSDSTLEQKQDAARKKELLRIQKQMAALDSMKNSTTSQLKRPAVSDTKEIQEPLLNTIDNNDNVTAITNNVSEVKKSNSKPSAFNTVGKEDNGEAITAMLDETVTVSGSSRIRIRLLEDVSINNILITKGSYLYGIVSGIKGQRVLISVKSIMLKGKLYKVNLSVYDNDGLAGFYIPDNLFRDLTKQVGSQAINQTFTIENSNQQLQQFLYKILMDVYRQTSQAIGQTIRKERATLKYNTQIYLINEDEN